MRRIVLPALLLLAACEMPDMAELERGAENALRASVFLPPRQDGIAPRRHDPPAGALEDEDAATTGGPTLLVSYGSQRKVMAMIQGNGEQRMWRSADGTVVATDGARVVATAGTATTLAATRFDSPDPLDDIPALAERPATARRVVDLAPATRDPNRMRFGVALECRMRAARVEEGLYVEERCGGGARFVNRYWADPGTGAVWRSEQWVGMDGRPMVIEVLSSPAN
ncbi:YjbF family lipoprotein [Roseomonas sp. SSH11]|uniref:YjbF family lipoprotein n=1 Tax=Pararoseomonas baculiformis TaxID=2820812 RepID=A0ABS4A8F4_9PROT|nr:YjbF family lipoprotein [Pararoseomonas baculiformis]MBP0443271.1 YjbF family lipoprotein [Pararoseomonas baculiformis]